MVEAINVVFTLIDIPYIIPLKYLIGQILQRMSTKFLVNNLNINIPHVNMTPIHVSQQKGGGVSALTKVYTKYHTSNNNTIFS